MRRTLFTLLALLIFAMPVAALGCNNCTPFLCDGMTAENGNMADQAAPAIEAEIGSQTGCHKGSALKHSATLGARVAGAEPDGIPAPRANSTLSKSTTDACCAVLVESPNPSGTVLSTIATSRVASYDPFSAELIPTALERPRNRAKEHIGKVSPAPAFESLVALYSLHATLLL